jgi:hypothetical protein
MNPTRHPMSRTARIATDIESMFEVMDRYLPEVVFPERVHLYNYYRGVATVRSRAPTPDQADPEEVKMGFYALLETHPRLRNVWVAAVELETLASCVRHIGALKKMTGQRMLTVDEQQAKDAAEAALRKAQSAFTVALNSCRS